MMFCPMIGVMIGRAGVSCRIIRLLALLSMWDNKAVMGVRGVDEMTCIGRVFLGVKVIGDLTMLSLYVTNE